MQVEAEFFEGRQFETFSDMSGQKRVLLTIFQNHIAKNYLLNNVNREQDRANGEKYWTI